MTFLIFADVDKEVGYNNVSIYLVMKLQKWDIIYDKMYILKVKSFGIWKYSSI